MNRCRPEEKDTKVHGRMLTEILKLEKERFQTGLLKDGQWTEKSVTMKECKILREEFEDGGCKGVQCVDEGKDSRVPLRGEAGGRSAKEHGAAYSSEEHGPLEADHRASWRTGRGHTVVHVLPLPPISG